MITRQAGDTGSLSAGFGVLQAMLSLGPKVIRSVPSAQERMMSLNKRQKMPPAPSRTCVQAGFQEGRSEAQDFRCLVD